MLMLRWAICIETYTVGAFSWSLLPWIGLGSARWFVYFAVIFVKEKTTSKWDKAFLFQPHIFWKICVVSDNRNMVTKKKEYPKVGDMVQNIGSNSIYIVFEVNENVNYFKGLCVSAGAGYFEEHARIGLIKLGDTIDLKMYTRTGQANYEIIPE